MKRNTSIFRGRSALLVALPLILACVALFALYDLQVMKTEYYAAQSRNAVYSTETVSAARGEILDRYGRVLVSNRVSMDVTIERKRLVEGDDPNGAILGLIQLVQAAGYAYTDTMPISRETPFAYLQDGQAAFQQYLDHFELEEDTSAADLLTWMRRHYAIPDSYTPVQARTAAGVRWELERRELFDGGMYIFSSDLDTNLISAISERTYPGVNIVTNSARQYNTAYAAHLLGRIGPITADEKDYYLEQGYPYNAYVGQEGVEKAFESQLHGTNGVRVTVRSEDGQIIDSYYQEEPKAGKNVCLTIDLNCQQVVEDALSAEIEKINRNRIRDARPGEEVQLAKSGAAVLIQVGTGDLLASASYPTFDLSNYSRDYAQLISDPSSPLFNRALQGTYAPGSTFKVVTATAGLREGAITPDTKIYDRGIIDEYEGYTYTCWVYPGSHGTINVREALQVSCNYFFYVVGRTLGIDVLDRYAANYGLGQATGIELYEEKGSLASKEYKENQIGESWYVGDTLQASIGQSYHLFTPLQLASYAATIAADGKRYGVHILHSVMSPDNGTILETVAPEILSEVGADAALYREIKEGMLMASRYGSASYVFRNYDIPVCSKTGTAQVNLDEVNNAVFIAFAPRDNPEIALAVVVENGANGYYLAEVARDIFDWYFHRQTEPTPVPEGQLLP